MRNTTTVQQTIKDKIPNAPQFNNSNSTIGFVDVRFQYVDGHDFFADLSFEMPSGKKIAIVGGSGCGKSTIMRLLFRFYDPIEGRILIINQDIRDVSLDSLRKSIGVIPQVSIQL